MDEFVAHRPAKPEGRRRLTPESRAAVDALADAIAAEVDHLMAVRWSRTEGAILEARAGREASPPPRAPAAPAFP